MEVFVKKLLTRLESEIARINIGCDAVKGYTQCICIVKNCIHELKSFLLANPCSNETAEIYFLKHAAPSIYSRFIYFTRLYILELHRITLSPQDWASFLSKELKEVSTFFEVHGDLHRYYYSQLDHHDQIIFTRKSCQQSSDDITMMIDSSLCANSVNLSKILAFEKYRIILKKELENCDPSRNLSIKKYVLI
jgi:RteC protein